MKNMIANYHTHTKRCGHATGEDREYIESAIQAGIQILGFSDHTPMPFEDGWNSGFRIPLQLADDYFYSLETLKKEYREDIEIKIGVEAEYYPESFEKYREYIEQYPLDYSILGQHFLYREQDCRYSGSPSDDPQKLADYIDNVLRAVETKKFAYIAHPDILNFTGSYEEYYRQIKPFLERIKKLEIPLEINRLGFFEHRHYPRDDFFKIAGEVGNKVIIGADAHSPQVFEDENSINGCASLAEKYGLEIVRKLKI
jgi:histidinol-phosphatase (PHP family)